MTKIVITGKDGIDRNMEVELDPISIMERMFIRAQRRYHEQIDATHLYCSYDVPVPVWDGEIPAPEPVQTVGGIKWRMGP